MAKADADITSENLFFPPRPTSQQIADSLLREWQTGRQRGIAPACRLISPDADLTIEQGLAVFALLVSLKKAKIGVRVVTTVKLPRYVRRDRSGALWFCVDQSTRVRLPSDPASRAFRHAYNQALVDAIAAEDDNDE